MGKVPRARGGRQLPRLWPGHHVPRLDLQSRLQPRWALRDGGYGDLQVALPRWGAPAVRAAGIPFEIVPGVTAGVAAPAYAGIPVTQRGMASAVAFVTGHEDPGKPETQIDWPGLARFPG